MTLLLTQTSQEFAEAIYKLLGKGRQHAQLLYEEFFREGTLKGVHPAFLNAGILLQDILKNTQAALPALVTQKGDGTTTKQLLRTHDNLEIESVLIPMLSGNTLCVSSQIGCRMGCSFCETGRMGLLRHLTTEEIVAQAFIARHQLGFSFRNIVFMGMGEPFDNYDAVLQAVRVLRDPHGFALGRRNITISTSGCLTGIARLQQEGAWAPNLAVSLNAPNNALRNKLMPINRKHPLEELHQALKEYIHATDREILIAYVMLREQNDSLTHAEELANYLQGLKVKINLIPYNPQSCDRFAPTEAAPMEAFAKHLQSRGFYTLVRNTKGRQVMAGCGQLGNLALRKQLSRH